MSRKERRAAERRNRGREARGLDRNQFIIMVVVTVAMIFSSFSYVLAYGGKKTALIVLGVIFALCVAGYLIYRARNRT